MRVSIIVLLFFINTIVHAYELPNVHVYFKLESKDFVDIFENHGQLKEAVSLSESTLVHHLRDVAGFLQFDTTKAPDFKLTFYLVDDAPDTFACSPVWLLATLADADDKPRSNRSISFRTNMECSNVIHDVSRYVSELKSVLERYGAQWIVRLLSVVEIAGPEVALVDGRGSEFQKIDSNSQGEILVARTPDELRMSMKSRLSFAFEMWIDDGTKVSRKKYHSHVARTDLKNVGTDFEGGIVSTLGFDSPSERDWFLRERTRLADIAAYMEEYYPAGDGRNLTALDQALENRDFGTAIRLSANERDLGNYAGALYGFRRVSEESDDKRLIGEARREWLIIGALGRWLDESSIKLLPVSRVEIDLNVEQVEQFLANPLNHESLVWKDDALVRFRERILINAGEELQREGKYGAALEFYEAALFRGVSEDGQISLDAATNVVSLSLITPDAVSLSASVLRQWRDLGRERFVGEPTAKARFVNVARISDILAQEAGTYDFAGWGTDDWGTWLDVSPTDRTLFGNWEGDDWDRWRDVSRVQATISSGWAPSQWVLWSVMDDQSYASDWSISHWKDAGGLMGDEAIVPWTLDDWGAWGRLRQDPVIVGWNTDQWRTWGQLQQDPLISDWNTDQWRTWGQLQQDPLISDWNTDQWRTWGQLRQDPSITDWNLDQWRTWGQLRQDPLISDWNTDQWRTWRQLQQDLLISDWNTDQWRTWGQLQQETLISDWNTDQWRTWGQLQQETLISDWNTDQWRTWGQLQQDPSISDWNTDQWRTWRQLQQDPLISDWNTDQWRTWGQLQQDPLISDWNTDQWRMWGQFQQDPSISDWNTDQWRTWRQLQQDPLISDWNTDQWRMGGQLQQDPSISGWNTDQWRTWGLHENLVPGDLTGSSPMRREER